MFKGNRTIKVLIIDDDEDDYILTSEVISEIQHTKYSVDWEYQYDFGIDKICRLEHDVYIVDYNLGSKTALHILEEIKEKCPFVPIIILTGKENKELDLLLMEGGACDYLVKSELTPTIIERSIRYAISNINQLRKLKEEEQKFRGIFEESVDPIFLCSCDLKITEVNNSFLELFNCTKEKIIDKSTEIIFSDQFDFFDFERNIKSDQQLKYKEVILLDCDGKELECQIATSPILDINKKTQSYQVIIHDLSIQKRAQRELLQAELLSVTGKMARSMAHEVRNPLTNLALALNELEDIIEETEETVIFTDIIKRNSKRIDQIISEMLNSSRESVIQKKLVNINETLNNCVSIVIDRITLQNMQLNLTIEHAPLEIELDESQIKIALNNILINAVEAMEPSKGVLNVTSQQRDGRITITIEDNGYGMDRSTINKLFNPFFTNKKGGMGLGLTTVSNIIKGHQGAIDIESTIGKGSKFIITLPLQQ